MKKLELAQIAIKDIQPEEMLSMLYMQNNLTPAKHINPLTKKQFHGKNIWTLELEMILKGYNSCEWSTFAQYRDNDSRVNKGEKGTSLTLAVFNTVKNEKGEKEEKLQFFKSYTVFNKEQTSNASEKAPAKEDVKVIVEEKQLNIWADKYAVVV